MTIEEKAAAYDLLMAIYCGDKPVPNFSAEKVKEMPHPEENEDYIPRLISIKEAAAMVNKSYDWVYRRVKRGEIPAVMGGDSSHYINLNSFKEFLKGK